MKADGKTIKKIECPYCGHKQKILHEKDAVCRGVYYKCQNPACKKEFEIRL